MVDGDCAKSVPGARCESGQCRRPGEAKATTDASIDAEPTGGAGGSGGSGGSGGGATPGAGGTTGTGAGDALGGRPDGGDASSGSGGAVTGAGGAMSWNDGSDGTDGFAGSYDPPDGPSGPCVTPLSGAAPFGATLSALVTFAEDAGVSPQATSFGVYFPAGRVPGAPVLLSRPSSLPVGGLVYSRATLDEDLNASVAIADTCANGLSGVLTGPGGGLLATVMVNTLDNYGDAIQVAQSRAWLCPTGSAPPATATLKKATTIPTGPIQLELSTPVDETTLAAVRVVGMDTVQASWPTVPSYSFMPQYYPQTGWLEIKPASGRAFPFGTVTLDLSGLRDVLGRPYQVQGSVSVEQPTAAIVDTTLTAVPSAAVVSTVAPTIANGTLSFPSPSVVQAVLGLGTAAGATRLRIIHRALCSQLPSYPISTLVSSDGVATPVTAACADGPQEVTTTLVGQGPYYLVIDLESTARPCQTPPVLIDRLGYEVDEFSFLP